MKRRNMLAAILTPALIGVAIIGTGFSTWYFAEKTGSNYADNKVYVADEADRNFSIALANGKNNGLLVLDQKDATYRPDGQEGKGLYLTDDVDEAGNKPSTADDGTDGLHIRVTYTGDAAPTSGYVLQWSAKYANNENFDKYLSQEVWTNTIELPTSDGDWTNQENTYYTDILFTAKDNLELTYSTAEGVVGEPTTTEELAGMRTDLGSLSLTLTFAVVNTASN